MRHFDKMEGSSYIQNWNINNLHGSAMSPKPLVNNFQWIEDHSQFNEDFRKTKTI